MKAVRSLRFAASEPPSRNNEIVKEVSHLLCNLAVKVRYIDHGVKYSVTKMATPSDDSLFLCVLFSNAYMARCYQRQAGYTSVEIKRLNNELVSLNGQL